MDRIRIELLPPTGYVIAELKSKLLFEPYAVENGQLRFRGSECLKTEPMIECHFFSLDREYRLIAREARGGLIERVLTAEEERAMDPDLLYEQEMQVKEEYARRGDLPEKLVVMNRYAFTENDTLTLQDYRIGCPRGHCRPRPAPSASCPAFQAPVRPEAGKVKLRGFHHRPVPLRMLGRDPPACGGQDRNAAVQQGVHQHEHQGKLLLYIIRIHMVP